MPSGTIYSPRAMVERLVSFDTTSSKSNLELIEFVRDYLAGHGVESVLVPNSTGDKASLFATVGPGDVGGIALSGHTDCVPADPAQWKSDPFAVTERDGRLYGRGTCDMKGFVGVVLAMVPEFVAAPLNTPLHIALSYDEELGCTGVRDMIAALGHTLPLPKAVIVGEPTEMEVVDAHKSISDFATEVTGREGHSSAIDKGANAIFAAGELLGELSRMRDDMIEAGDPSGRFEPPFTSVHVGMISGGTALNIIPGQCRFNWELRALPKSDEAALVDRFERFGRDIVLPRLRAVAPEAGIVTERHIHAPGLAPDPGSLAERLAMRLAARNEARAVSFATEAGLFQKQGAPSVVCGPGSIAQAHKPDEFIELTQLAACEEFLRALLDLARKGI